MRTKVEKIYEKPTKIWNMVFISVFVANACMNLSQQMMNSLVSKYADHLGATASMVGLVYSMFAITALIFKLFSGPAIDSFNRKYILMGALVVMATAYFGYSISGNVHMLLGFRLLQGIGQAFTATCCLALAADALPADQFGAGIGMFSLAQAACQAIGPSLALTLVSAVGYNTTFLIGCIIMLCAVIAASGIRAPHISQKKFTINFKSIIAVEAIMPASLIFLLGMVFNLINSFLILYAGVIGVGNHIGWFFTVYACSMLITRPMVGKLTDKFGMVKVIIPAMICYAVSFTIIAYSKTLPMFIVAALVAAFGYGACQPAIQSLCMKSVPTERRGAASSTSYIGNDLASISGPIIGGIIVENLGYGVMWHVAIVPIIVAALAALLFRKKINSIETNFANRI